MSSIYCFANDLYRFLKNRVLDDSLLIVFLILKVLALPGFGHKLVYNPIVKCLFGTRSVC